MAYTSYQLLYLQFGVSDGGNAPCPVHLVRDGRSSTETSLVIHLSIESDNSSARTGWGRGYRASLRRRTDLSRIRRGARRPIVKWGKYPTPTGAVMTRLSRRSYAPISATAGVLHDQGDEIFDEETCPYCGKSVASPYRVTVETVKTNPKRGEIVAICVVVVTALPNPSRADISLFVNGSCYKSETLTFDGSEPAQFNLYDQSEGLYFVIAQLQRMKAIKSERTKSLFLSPNLRIPLARFSGPCSSFCSSPGVRPWMVWEAALWRDAAKLVPEFGRHGFTRRCVVDRGPSGGSRLERTHAGRCKLLARQAAQRLDAARAGHETLNAYNNFLNKTGEIASSWQTLTLIGALPWITFLIWMIVFLNNVPPIILIGNYLVIGVPSAIAVILLAVALYFIYRRLQPYRRKKK